MKRKELFNQIEINFYDFSYFEYYALIVAENIEDAIKGYKEVVADIEDEALEPRIIDRQEALKRYINAEHESCKSQKEKIQEFFNNLSEFKNPSVDRVYEYLVMLIDGSLL